MLADDPTLPADVAPAAGDDGFDGDRVGRYLLMREIGRGAMGRVFAGFDPDLQRSVAVKLVQDGRRELDPSLLREGRVLASLSHPNIVPVFDLGRDGERVFVVMELVDGMSLLVWLAAAPRSTHAIVRAWCDAGAGLAAAHELGIVHRDFKASNVLIGKNGRVRVADFGLARTADPDEGADARPYEGTRPYLAPEVFATGAATPAVDQFAFCKSLEHALEGRTLSRRLRDVIARGLAEDPAKRWPAMSALVVALDRTLRVPRAVLVAGGAALIAGIVAGGVMLAGDPGCESADSMVARVLGERRVDVGAWRARYGGACTNPQLARCLEDRLVDLAAVLDDAAIDRFDERLALAQWNTEVAACPGSAAAARESREFRHAIARVRLLSGTSRHAEAVAAADVAVAKANEPAAKIRARVIRLQVEQGADPAPFEALYADALATADPQLPGEVAIAAAEHCLDHGTPCAGPWIQRIVERIEGVPSPEHEAKLFGLRGDQAVLEGNEEVAAGMYAEEVRRLTALRGEHSWAVYPGLIDHSDALFNLRRFDEALRVAQRADALVVRWVGEDHPFRSATLWSMGNARLALDQRPAARADFERAIALESARAGETPITVASLMGNLSAVYADDGDLARALEMTDRACAIYDRASVHDRAYQAALLRQAAIFAGNLGHDARSRIDRAFEVARNLAPSDPLWGDLYTTRAIIHVRAGALDEAQADLREALARWAKLPGDRGTRIANAESRLAGILLRRDQPRQARAALDRARTAIGERDSAVYLLHEAEYARASRGDAKPVLAKLVPMFEPPFADPRLAAHVFAVAGDRARAVETLRAAGVRETALAEDCITCAVVRPENRSDWSD